MLASLMGRVLDEWNQMTTDAASEQILPCCGSRRWALELSRNRPYSDSDELCRASDRVWESLAETDWQEAFESHPRIGERDSRRDIDFKSRMWSQEEQRTIAKGAEGAIASELADANVAYEAKFGRIFIVCATGKTAGEVLDLLHSRLANDATTELILAVEEQRKITQLRLRRWLEEAA